METTFNVPMAVNKLVSSAKSSSIHKCAMYVRQAMEAGGLSTIGRPDWACKYVDWLPNHGWELIKTCITLNEKNDFTKNLAKPGDIAVYQKPGCVLTQPGHICMFSGTQWISDFKQNSMDVYSGKSTIHIFRYKS